jgi:hyperosmotically inducible protein
MNHRIENRVLSTAFASILAVTLAACDKPMPSLVPAPATTTIGNEVDDSVVTSRVKSALLESPDIKAFDFKVETRKGEVMLGGFVDNQAQLDLATAATRAVPGVKSVLNNVTLKGASATVGNTIDDSLTTSKVKAALLGDATVKSFDIAVVTRKDEVQLSGFVDNQTQIDRAVQVAGAVDGVRKVINEMSIKK